MLREAVKKHYIGMNKEFRHRGEEPGRLENFSDAVFALAITLLLISTSAPNTFDQILRFTYDLIPFVLCITLILLIWYEHFIFYYRYGIRNGKIIFFNTAFLVIVLFYVYPLKFLSRLILIPIGYVTGNEDLVRELSGLITEKDIGDLMIIYGLGAAGIFFILMMMYRYALQKAEELELNEIERFDTQVRVQTNFIMGLIPVISVIISFIFRGHWLAGMLGGFTYFLYTPVMAIYGSRVRKKRVKVIEAMANKEALITSSAESQPTLPD